MEKSIEKVKFLNFILYDIYINLIKEKKIYSIKKSLLLHLVFIMCDEF